MGQDGETMIVIEPKETNEVLKKTRAKVISPYLRYEPLSEAREFRIEILSAAIANLPVYILVNERNGSYSVRDNSLLAIWSDELPKGGGTELIYDLASLICPEDQASFLDAFSAEAQAAAYHRGADLRSRFALGGGLCPVQGRPVMIGIQFGAGSGGKVYELEITQDRSGQANTRTDARAAECPIQ